MSNVRRHKRKTKPSGMQRLSIAPAGENCADLHNLFVARLRTPRRKVCAAWNYGDVSSAIFGTANNEGVSLVVAARRSGAARPRQSTTPDVARKYSLVFVAVRARRDLRAQRHSASQFGAVLGSVRAHCRL